MACIQTLSKKIEKCVEKPTSRNERVWAGMEHVVHSILFTEGLIQFRKCPSEVSLIIKKTYFIFYILYLILCFGLIWLDQPVSRLLLPPVIHHHHHLHTVNNWVIFCHPAAPCYITYPFPGSRNRATRSHTRTGLTDKQRFGLATSTLHNRATISPTRTGSTDKQMLSLACC